MKRLGIKLRNSATLLRNHGLKYFGCELWYRLIDFYHERRFGVSTERVVTMADVGIDEADAHDSMPISYKAFYSMIKSMTIDLPNSTFLDYGVGKGRAVCAAAALPFRRVIGVEISKHLVNVATQNLSRMRVRKTSRFDVIEIDATRYDLPDEVNVIYFFNPFSGNALKRVVENIKDSYQRCPRKIHIVFFNDDHFEKIISNHPWIVNTQRTRFHPDVTCGLYETRA